MFLLCAYTPANGGWMIYEVHKFNPINKYFIAAQCVNEHIKYVQEKKGKAKKKKNT